MKKIILIGLSIVMVAGCGKSKPNKDSDDEGRSLASVQGKQERVLLPDSARKFLLDEEQRLKPQVAIKHYAHVLPPNMYKRLVKLSLNVDDLGLSITRKGNTMILDNGKGTLKIGFTGPVDHMLMVLDGETYDFANAQSINKLLENLEKNIGGTTKTAAIDSLLFKMCPALGILGMSEDSHASNWFLLGGLAIVGVAIAYAAYTLGNSIKKTKHDVNVKGQVSLDQSSKDAIAELSDAVKNGKVDVNLETNHNINVDAGSASGIL
ncbi:MAG: hypothetical protein M9899_11135 [Bdellovibrionaceae bacterium]|nr:hypothetical protein [Pseudobdellovibrionaceae bacterium]